jgi:uncharacterized protein DUF1579
MSILDGLAACAGSWRGTNKLQDPHSNLDEDSPATATVTSVLGGRFVRLDYTWDYKGAPQEGSILIGYEAKTDTATAHWIDTWHMGSQVMALAGPGGPTLAVKGTYAAPPGPDWGWRIEITPSEESLRMVMFNIWPEGKEDLAVEAVYERI